MAQSGSSVLGGKGSLGEGSPSSNASVTQGNQTGRGKWKHKHKKEGQEPQCLPVSIQRKQGKGNNIRGFPS